MENNQDVDCLEMLIIYLYIYIYVYIGWTVDEDDLVGGFPGG